MFVDQGAAAPNRVLTLTLYLKPTAPNALAALVAATQRPGDPNFHRFLSHDQFVARFAPGSEQISRVTDALSAAGLTPDSLFGNRLALRVQGTVAALNTFFGLDIHEVSRDGSTFLASTRQPVFPASIRTLAEGLGGFETVIPSAPGPDLADQTNTTGITAVVANAQFPAGFAKRSGVSNPPGQLTPLDFERLYDVMPIAGPANGGRNRTIAIVTEQNFDPAVPEAFWKRIGVTRSGTFELVHIEGSAEDAEAKTTESDIDTEQAGAIAPAASLIAYVAPGGPASLLDAYETVASENRADVVSSSFGTPELYFLPNGTEISNPTLLPVFSDIFSEMAVQGQTVFVAAGDAGAFDVNRNESGNYEVFPTVGAAPAYSAIHSVNGVASSPLVTACGGTTLPFFGTDESVVPSLPVSVAVERAWSPSYLVESALAHRESLQTTIDLFEVAFPSGGGGGVSAIWPLPDYQRAVPGMTVTQPGQSLIRFGTDPAVVATLPGEYPGRNIPDLSAESDPHTGYIVLDQTDKTAILEQHSGGTSFVAPQFAATMALIDAALGHRVGQLNPLLYRLQSRDGGSVSPVTAPVTTPVTAGDNWGYEAHAGYNQATGLGTLDGYKLYRGLASYD